jgi:NAD(P)-dependent dehydrogenase (short-subunit alcohol dehydrogenase family)
MNSLNRTTAVKLQLHCTEVTLLATLRRSAYSTSKAANLKMLDYFAAENPGVRSVSLHPGVVDTEINEGTLMKGQDDGESFCW